MAVDFQEEINDGILRSHNFICVISPHGIQSQHVKKEIELAVRLKKRIIPVLHVEPSAAMVNKYLHPRIAKLNWVYFRDDIEVFEEALHKLLEAISHRIDFVRTHTFVLYKSQLWKENQKKEDYLLLGSKRKVAQEWLEIKFEDEQPPVEVTNQQCQYTAQSRWLAERFASDVFIVSAPDDSYWQKKIKFALLRLGKTVSDRTDLIPNVNQDETLEFHIINAKHIVHLVSLESKGDTDNTNELELSVKYNKPIVRVFLDDVEFDNTQGQIGRLSFKDVQIGDSFRTKLNELLRFIEQEDDYFTKHQKLLIRATNWERQKENPALLLRGNLLQQAQVWAESAHNRTHNPPLDFQQKFISE
ncbi:MAG: toll/interleukin-1 receptor domain-containing protein [Okeania sp. SIO3C4]|nr:toll/interleukin-1 receptor domain-containing protein [Okeania sp. SIO3C4]